MKILWTFLILFWILSLPAFAEHNLRKAVTGSDPRFDATISRSPLDQFIKETFRPDPTKTPELGVSYEEAIPYQGSYYPDEGTYYPQEGRYYEEPALPQYPPEEKSYYEGGGRYYLPPEPPEE